MTERRAPYGDVTERDFQQQLVDAARWLGWLCFHTFDSRKSEPGFPDMICVGTGANRGRLLAIELKSESGRVSAEQLKWLTGFMDCGGVETHIFRPAQVDQAMALLQPRKRAEG